MARYRGIYRIETTRLPGWDYAWPGWYFVTICTKGRARSLGTVEDGQVRLSKIGRIAHRFWAEIPDHFPHAVLDAFVIMPDHVHGIVGIRDGKDVRGPCRDVACYVSTRGNATYHDIPDGPAVMSAILPRPHALGTMMRSYKSAVTRWARRNGHAAFAWQPRYYDHILRDERALRAVRRYVENNPARWG